MCEDDDIPDSQQTGTSSQHAAAARPFRQPVDSTLRNIATGNLRDGMTLGRSVFDPWGGLLACAGTPVTDMLISTMNRRNVHHCIISDGDPTETPLDIIDRLIVRIASAAGSPDTFSRVTDEVGVRLTRLLNSGVYGYLDLDEKTQRDITGLITSAAGRIAPLFDVTIPEDDSEQRDHAIMTAVLSVLHSRRQRYSDDVMDSIVTGALLHDCGKSVLHGIGVSACHQAGHELYSEHPVFGYVLAHRAGLIGDSPECEVILRHHERPDSSGFPAGIPIDGSVLAAGAIKGSDSVVPIALLISVMNSYDNTVRVSSSDHLAVHNACRELIFNAETRYHKDAVRSLVEFMRLYPVGATVCITDIGNTVLAGSRGIVASVDEDTGLPSIVVTTDSDGHTVEPVRIDTSRLRSITLNLEL